ncbi:beta-1,3-galactosyltransferase 1-like [Asterias rubens]|uniref:beta-1,3-galactosyltransferase 1-like n=1 Tax=Asterias rubens TaxID=7604 RepID=UPI001455C7F3|nr:beta-1,3-galactosyltransferase 1-like [Asterias rubens]
MARVTKLRTIFFALIIYGVFWLNLMCVMRYGPRINRVTLGDIITFKRNINVTFSGNTSWSSGAATVTSTHATGTTKPFIGTTFRHVTVVVGKVANNRTKAVEPVTANKEHASKPIKVQVAVKPDPKPAVNPHLFNFTITNEGACKNRSDKNGNLFLVFLVKCKPEERFDREQIRQTWGGVTEVLGQRILTMFLVGQSADPAVRGMLQNEDERTHDFIQEDFNEGYFNLTYKTLMGFRWVMTHCPRVSYVVSVDADMMINVRNLVQRLKTMPRANFAEGNLRTGYKPHRDIGSKWYVTKQEYSRPSYPPWLNGGCYVFSSDVATRVYKTSANVPFFKLDDVYIGIVLAKVKVKPRLSRYYQQYIVNKQVALRTGIGIGIRHNENQVNEHFKLMWNNTVGALLEKDKQKVVSTDSAKKTTPPLKTVGPK